MACDDLITNQDLENAKKDAATMSDFVESDSPEIQSKNGKNIRTLQGINDAADNLISSLGGTDIGDYEDDLTLNSYNEYVVFDRAGATTGPSLWKAIPPRTPTPGTPLPYTIDSTTNPDPTNDPNIEPFSDINKAGAEQIAQEEANDGDSQLAGGNIWPLSSQKSVSISPPFNDVPVGTEILNDANFGRFSFDPIVSGIVTSWDPANGVATIGGVDVILTGLNFKTPSVNSLTSKTWPNGAIVTTLAYYDGWAAQLEVEGSGRYSIATLQQVRDAFNDPSWEPDGFANHYLTGNQSVAMLITDEDGFYTASQIGIVAIPTQYEQPDKTDPVNPAYDPAITNYDISPMLNGVGGNARVKFDKRSYYISSTWLYSDGAAIQGAGVKGDYLYANPNNGTQGGTLFVVEDGVSAFKNDNLIRKQFPSFKDFGMRARTFGSSPAGATELPANFSPNTNGIDLSATVDANVENVRFESIDRSIYSDDYGQSLRPIRPRVTNPTWQDCNYMVNYITGADAHITDITIGLHCTYGIICNNVDGIEGGNWRIFQVNRQSLDLTDCPQVQLSGVTFFETAQNQIKCLRCTNLHIEGLNSIRAGWYDLPLFTAWLAVDIEDCTGVYLRGVIERPSGNALRLTDVINMDIDINFINPNNNGGAGGSQGVQVLGNCSGNINGRLNGVVSNTPVAINVSVENRYTVKTNMSSDLYFKNMRYIETDASIVTAIVEAGQNVAAGGSTAPIFSKQYKVPAGKKLDLMNIRYQSLDGLRPRIGSNFFLTLPSTDEGLEGEQVFTLLDNTGGSSTLDYDLEIRVYNDTGAAIVTELTEIVAALKIRG